MRVPDQFLKSVAFIAEVIHEDSSGADLDHQATGFFVTVRSALPGASYPFFVTARHAAAGLAGRDVAIRVNNKNGGSDHLRVIGDSWYLHPSDDSVDVAAIPCLLTPQSDVVSVSINSFLTRELIEEKKVGIGDETFTVGLFTPAVGSTRNMPIVRYGNIAMLPAEQVQVDSQFADVYLIEARSILGISGSPVFVRQTLAIDGGRDSRGQQRSLCGASSEGLFLGLIHGHWDVRESDLNKPSFIHSRPQGVNLGVAIVVPAYRVLEVINQPRLIALREAYDAEIRKGRMPGVDTRGQ